MMPELSGQIGELRFTVEIKRKDTGKIEQYELVGFIDEDKLKEFQNGSHPLDGSTQRCD
jgi:hypothetical protein